MSQVDSGQKFLVCCVGPFYGKYGLRIIRIQMGNQDGDGMDGGFLGHQNLGGGRFKFKFCFLEENRCCQTENLNTDDDNWEKGHVNYFVGHQIDACENFPLAYEGNQH